MNAKKVTLTAISAALLGLASLPSHSAVLFSQDFEGALGANETTAGVFRINTTGINVNGSARMGHAQSYSNYDYSYYRINGLTLTGGNILLSFDYAASFETYFDRFNVRAGNTIVQPTANSAMQYSGVAPSGWGNPLVGQLSFDSSNAPSGRAEFDLTPFSGSTIDLLFQFGSDLSVTGPGINLDNVRITNDQADAVRIPEPASFALLGLGLAGLGLNRRKRS